MSRAPIHQYQHAPRCLIGKSVVGREGPGSGELSNLKTRNQAKQLCEIPRPAGRDHLPIQDSQGPRGVALGLKQAGAGEDHWKFAEEGAFTAGREGLRSERGGAGERSQEGEQTCDGAAKTGDRHAVWGGVGFCLGGIFT